MKQKTKQLNSRSHQSSRKQHIHDLIAFKKKYGHCNVPSRYSLNSALGSWVARVRRAKKHGTLVEDIVCHLDALEFSWERRTTWEQHISDLKAFKKKHGHCNVSHKYQPDLALGQWVADTRKRKKHGKLDAEMIQCLDALGFCWERQTTWEEYIHDLKAFKKEHGHCEVPNRYQPNLALGLWVSNLRQRKKLGTLAKDKILNLDGLGFVWELKRGRPRLLENAATTCVPSKTRRSR